MATIDGVGGVDHSLQLGRRPLALFGGKKYDSPAGPLAMEDSRRRRTPSVSGVGSRDYVQKARVEGPELLGRIERERFETEPAILREVR